MIGDRRPYVTALITLEEDARGLPDIEARIQALVDEVNGELSRFEQIKRFRDPRRATSPPTRARSRRP